MPHDGDAYKAGREIEGFRALRNYATEWSMERCTTNPKVRMRMELQLPYEVAMVIQHEFDRKYSSGIEPVVQRLVSAEKHASDLKQTLLCVLDRISTVISTLKRRPKNVVQMLSAFDMLCLVETDAETAVLKYTGEYRRLKALITVRQTQVAEAILGGLAELPGIENAHDLEETEPF